MAVSENNKPNCTIQNKLAQMKKRVGEIIVKNQIGHIFGLVHLKENSVKPDQKGFTELVRVI